MDENLTAAARSFVERWDRYFLLPTGSVDLFAMSEKLNGTDFRTYIECSRHLRALPKN